jgi:nucleoside 2-deoxyribosyltransferase
LFSSGTKNRLPRIKLYVASPLGFSEAGRYFLKESFMPLLRKMNFEILDPWEVVMKQDTKEILKGAKSMPREQAIEIGKMNARMIREADAVLAVLDGPDVDSGVASEIGYACGVGKKILGYRGDFRLSTDIASCSVNIQVESFVKASGGELYTTLDDVMKSLSEL